MPSPLAVQEIPLERLHEAPWNANRMTAANLERVRNSIRQFGVVENLVARPLPDPCPACGGRDHLEVISGNHRLRLYGEEDVDPAPCHIVELDDARAMVRAAGL